MLIAEKIIFSMPVFMFRVFVNLYQLTQSQVALKIFAPELHREFCDKISVSS